jgi:hypothetical protein
MRMVLLVCSLFFIGLSESSTYQIEAAPKTSASLRRYYRLLGLTDADTPMALPKMSGSSKRAGDADGTILSITDNGWSGPFYSKGPSSLVWDIAPVSGGFIAAGEFSGVDEYVSALVAKWSGSAWSSELSGFRKSNGRVLALLPIDGTVIAGGYFDSLGEKPCLGIARWNAAGWESIGKGLSAVTALSEWNGTIIAAAADDGIRSWNGSEWAPMGARISGVISRIETVVGKIWIAGDFTLAGNQGVQNLAVWDGTSWKAQSGTTIDPVRDIIVVDTEAFIIQNNVRSGEPDTQTIRKWDGVKWEYCGFPSSMVMKQSLATDLQNVYLVGSTGNIRAPGFAGSTDMSEVLVSEWTVDRFQTVASARIDGRVFTAAVSGGDLIMGGAFSHVGALRTDNLVSWNGTGFHALSEVSTPAPSFKSATLFSDGQALYFGRSYGAVENTDNGAISRWNGFAWDSLDGGFRNTIGPLNGTVPMVRFASVNAIASGGGKIIAGGQFDSTASLPARNIAQWNGALWEPMGTGYEGVVYAVQAFGGAIVAAGNPDWGGIKAKEPRVVSRWSNGKWEPMSGGMEGIATGLVEYKGALYATGYLTFPRDESTYCLAKWDGSIWAPVAGFAQDSINGGLPFDGLKVFDQSLYLVNSVAGLRRWDGANLSGMLLEAEGACAMAVSGQELFLYGNIRTPNSVSCLVAKWDGVRCTPVLSGMAEGYAQTSSMPMCVYKGSLYLSTERITGVNGMNATGYAKFNLDGGAGVRRPIPNGQTLRKTRALFQTSHVIFGYGPEEVRLDGKTLEKLRLH